jgi:glycosyltransferase involved in cell wall biosynthesis
MGEVNNLNNPLFTIIIPTFNRSKELIRCLNSLCEQTYKNFEVIISDDGSTDDTKEVVSNFKNKLKIIYIYNENWGGPAKPRNNGISFSNAPWLCFLDSDDWWYPNKLKEYLKYINHYDFIFHQVNNYIGDKLQKKSIYKKILNLFILGNRNILFYGNNISCSSVCINRYYTNIKFFTEDKELIALEDYFAWINLFQHNNIRIKYINKPLSAYSLGDDNISSLNSKYLFKLIAFKRKIKKDLNLDTTKTCLNYLIGKNHLYLNNKFLANKYFTYSLLNSKSILIKLKSLFYLLK